MPDTPRRPQPQVSTLPLQPDSDVWLRFRRDAAPLTAEEYDDYDALAGRRLGSRGGIFRPLE